MVYGIFDLGNKRIEGRLTKKWGAIAPEPPLLRGLCIQQSSGSDRMMFLSTLLLLGPYITGIGD